MRGLRASIGLGLLLGLSGFLASILAGCSRRETSSSHFVPPRRPSRVSAVAPSRADAEAAKAVVVRYLGALYEQDYPTAHNLLSAESRRRHTLEEFAREARSAQVLYDLAGARIESIGEQTAEVVVPLQQEEEPGAKAFAVVKEDGQWRVVYYRGKPFFPYEE